MYGTPSCVDRTSSKDFRVVETRLSRIADLAFQLGALKHSYLAGTITFPNYMHNARKITRKIKAQEATV